MNPMPHPDHPDADVLNAFAEHALSGAERLRIVAHLGDCERCREIVFLSRAVAEPVMAAGPAVRPEQRPDRHLGWFFGAFARWRVALIPAAALASAGAIVLWVHFRPVPTRPETARPAQQTASARASAPSQGLEQTAPPLALADPDHYVGNSARSATASKPNQAGQISGLQPKSAVPPAIGISDMKQLSSAAPDMGDTAGQQRAANPIPLDAHSASLARYAPPPEPVSPPSVVTFSAQTAVEPQRQGGANRLASGIKAAATGAGAAPAAPAPAPPPPNILALHGSLVSPPMGGPSPVAGKMQSGTEAAPQPLNEFAVMRLARRAKLPSGLITVSSAALLNRLIAVDSAGSVFLSEDGGKHWDSIPAQWSGKALAVQAPPLAPRSSMTAAKTQNAVLAPESTEVMIAGAADESPNSVPAPPPRQAGANAPPLPDKSLPESQPVGKAAPPGPDLLFRLVTNRHEVWVSDDGKAWRRQ